MSTVGLMLMLHLSRRNRRQAASSMRKQLRLHTKKGCRTILRMGRLQITWFNYNLRFGAQAEKRFTSRTEG